MNLEKEFCNLFDDMMKSKTIKNITNNIAENVVIPKIMDSITNSSGNATKSSSNIISTNIANQNLAVDIYVECKLQNVSDKDKYVISNLLKRMLLETDTQYKNMSYEDIYKAIDSYYKQLLSLVK